MIRIPSAAGCQAMSSLVTTPMGGRDREQPLDLTAAENPECPQCGKPTIWNTGRYGIYFKCPDDECGGTVDARRGPRRSRQDRSGGGARQPGPTRRCPEAGCNGRLVRRSGRYGPFLGCTNYPDCRHTERSS